MGSIFNSLVMNDQTEFFSIIETTEVESLSEQIDYLSRYPSIEGVLVMSIHLDPLRLRIIFDAEKTSRPEVQEWLTVNGIPLAA